MKKGTLTALLHLFSLTKLVTANWYTIEHNVTVCDKNVNTTNLAIHVNDDGNYYTDSPVIRSMQSLNTTLPLITQNVTWIGCTFNCTFSHIVQLNVTDQSVSVIVNDTTPNYKCENSTYTDSIIPSAFLTYQGPTPDKNHIFPATLTSHYCKKGIHPDAPTFTFPSTDQADICIDRLLGLDDGTFAESLKFGQNSSVPHTGSLHATYHMVTAATNLFDYWDTHHQATQDAINNLIVNIKEKTKKD